MRPAFHSIIFHALIASAAVLTAVPGRGSRRTMNPARRSVRSAPRGKTGGAKRLRSNESSRG